MRVERWVLPLWLLLTSAAWAAETPSPAATDPPAIEADRGAGPDEALLEFLGAWETDDGQWIDPAELETLDLPPAQPQEQERHESQ